MKNLSEKFNFIHYLLNNELFLVGMCIGAIGAFVLIIASHSFYYRKGGDDEQE